MRPQGASNPHFTSAGCQGSQERERFLGIRWVSREEGRRRRQECREQETELCSSMETGAKERRKKSVYYNFYNY